MSAITNQIDNMLGQYWQAIVYRQEQYYNRHREYWQGLATCSVAPADGALASNDQWDRRAPTESLSWRDVWGGDPPAGMTASLKCDQYVGPTGAGWVLTVQVRVAGVLMERRDVFGPETYRAAGWREAHEPL